MKQMMNVMVPMRDGVRLSCDIRLPDGPGPFPAALVRNPYNKAVPATDPVLRDYLAGGYAHVVQDVRGKHESEGVYRPFAQEAEDGHDTVMWVAGRPWCNGDVVMTGGSYCSWTQLAAAREAPEPLRAVAPSFMGSDPYRDIMFSGGVPVLPMAWWAILNSGRSQREEVCDNWPRAFGTLPLCRLDETVGCPAPALHEWLDHPARDAYWRAMSVEPRYGAVRAAMLLVGGWYDPFCPGMVRAYCGMAAAGRDAGRDDVRLRIGPWGHDMAPGRTLEGIDFGPSSVRDIRGMHRAFFDAALGRAAIPDDLRAPVEVFVMGRNQWRQADRWPPAGTQATAWHLGGGGAANSLFGNGALLPGAGDDADRDQFTFNPQAPVPAIGGAHLLQDRPLGPHDQRPAERRDDVLCYTGEPLAAPVEIIGPVRAELHVSSSAPDTDFVSRLCDVHPDGRSIILCDGVLRTRFREGLDREVLMTPGEVYRLEIDMGATAHAFLPGHRIRVEITSSCFPKWAPNPNTGGDAAREESAVVARQTVYHSARYPSNVTLPVQPA